MFGYVRPVKAKLSEAEFAKYQAVYCGLCHRLRAQNGMVAPFFLNYDFTFLAMVLAGEAQTSAISLRRCAINPLRRREAWEENRALATAADESVILTYWKLRDGVTDGRLLGKLPPGLGAAGLLGAYRGARGRCPDFDRTVRLCLEELRALERSQCASLDQPADAFARILQAAGGASGQAGSHALGQMLYHIGRWIYLIDAWDDLEKDRKSGSYNPILACYGSRAQEEKESLRQTLYTSLGMAGEAAAWLEFGPWTALVENVITLGLPAVEEAVLSGQYNSRRGLKKQRSKADE